MHAQQCATLAESEGADDELVVATLLHDFGRLIVADRDLTDSVGDGGESPPQYGGHGELGADRLRDGRDSVLHSQPCRGKRYLCTTEPAYFAKLSKGSVVSLEKQGGKMDHEERDTFESSPYVPTPSGCGAGMTAERYRERRRNHSITGSRKSSRRSVSDSGAARRPWNGERIQKGE